MAFCVFLHMMNSFYPGDHTDAAYSRCSLTNDLYSFKNISLSKKVKVLNISPRYLLPCYHCIVIIILLSICSVNFKDLSTVTPKSFSLSTFVMILDSVVLIERTPKGRLSLYCV